MLVEFASVVDAVRCAVDDAAAGWRTATPTCRKRRIRFRIGINLGDVIVEDGDIFGDGVNVAARLEALAEPGGICVSASVREQVGEKLPIGFDDIGRAQRQEHRPAGARLPRREARRARVPATSDHGADRRFPTGRRSRCCRSRT